MSIAENSDIENWIAKETPETAIEPELPIIDPHHHLWDLRKNNQMGFRQEVYLCEEISNDIQDSGHNVVQTVFAQCGAFYRADGPQEMKCIGETEFVNGIAAITYRCGASLRRIQTGNLRQYVMFIVVGTVVVFALASFWRYALAQ